jgi:hypothetical protein
MSRGGTTMNKLRFKSFSIFALVAVICSALLIGCGSQKLSGDFNEEEVKKAAENVILLINGKESEGIREICTVQMKEALTEDVMKQIYEAISEGVKFTKVEEMSVAGKTDKLSEEELAVVVTKAKYEIKTFIFTISFTKQMKLAGLYYK